MQQETIFTKIINGEIPSHKIYEDDFTYAFLDIQPNCYGHTLVVHKNPAPFVWDLTNEQYAQLMDAVRKIAMHYRQVAGKKYVGTNIVGTDVPHNHIHIKPFDETAELHGKFTFTDDELAQIAAKLKLHA